MSNDILRGGTAVITGAAGGIGAGVARAAAAAGMNVVLADVAPLAAITEELAAAGANVLPIPTDVTDPAALDHLAKATADRFGPVRLLVNNAGIEVVGSSWELSAAQWDRAIRINALGPIHGVRAFAGAMIASGQPGFICNIASLAAVSIMAEQAPYIVSKHAALAFSECLFLEMSLAAPQIRVSCVLPGPVATRIFKDAEIAGASEGHRAAMEQIISAHGMTGDEAGKIILGQIVEGGFWISTHPEMMVQTAKERAEHLAALDLPKLKSEALAILGRG